MTTPGYRDPSLQPFRSDSVWNAGIGTGAIASLPGDADTIQARRTFQVNIASSSFSMPFYIGTASDPLVTVSCSGTIFPIQTYQIHIPSGAAPSPDSDHHACFYDQTQPNLFFSYNGMVVTDATHWTSNLGYVADVCGTGFEGGTSVGAPSGQSDAGASAGLLNRGLQDNGFGHGVIRTWEWNAGVIKHMLRCVFPLDALKSGVDANGVKQWDVGIAWPNTHEDYGGATGIFGTGPPYSGSILYGSTLYIPGSVDVTTLGLSAGGLIIARCLQDYGCMIRDSGGNTGAGMTLYSEQGSAGNAALAQAISDMPLIVTHLVIMRNQAPATPNGGGPSRVAAQQPPDVAICGGAVIVGSLKSYFQSLTGYHSISAQTAVPVSGALYEVVQDHNGGIDVGMAIIDYYIFEGSTIDTSGNALIINYWNSGGLVGVSCFLPNPQTGGGAQDTTLNAANLLNTGSASHAAFLVILDQVAAGLQVLKNANIPVVFRLFWEQDGTWFWWSSANFTPAQFTQLWALAYNYLVTTKGLTNLTWAWSTNGTAATVMTWYPGDAYVDILGFDAYGNDMSQWQGVYNQITAGAPTKLFALTEWGSGGPDHGDRSFNVQTLISYVKTNMPKLVYINAWSALDLNGWAWYVMTNMVGGLSDPWVVNRQQVVHPSSPTSTKPQVICLGF